MERKPSCNFFGHLRNEETACVSVTGCPGDEMSLMINSKNSGARSMFILHKDGSVEVVESAFKVRNEFPYILNYKSASNKAVFSKTSCNNVGTSKSPSVKIIFSNSFNS